MLADSSPIKNLTYAYDKINRLETITDNLGGGEDVTYAYDSNGNTLTKTKNGVTTTFLYDVRDQLGEVQQGTDTLGRYGYDAEGMRILKIGDDGRRHYTYDQLSVITESDQVNATVSKYDYGLDQLVRLDNRTEGKSFFHLDILGSTVNLTEPFGATRQSILYDAWGNERERVGASANNFTFTGHEKDEETGLIYAKARFYDPDVGRFLTQDSYLGDVTNVPSLHRYYYVLQNPFRFVDLDGRQATEVSEDETERAAREYLDSLAPEEREALLKRAQSITSTEDVLRGQTQQRRVEEENQGQSGFFARFYAEGKRRVLEVIEDAGELREELFGPAGKWVGEKTREGMTEVVRPGEHRPLTPSEETLRQLAETEPSVELEDIQSERLRESVDGLKETTVEGSGIVAEEVTEYALEATAIKVVSQTAGAVIMVGGKPFRVARYTQRSRAHVYDHGHAANAPVQINKKGLYKSRFRPREGGQKFTDEILNHPNVVISKGAHGRVVYTVKDVGRVTGRGRNGQMVRGGRVVVEGPNPNPKYSVHSTDDVVTQHPY